MYLDSRRIRSAGKGSGSIEVTLPIDLEGLEDVECRLILRDGPRPEVALQPDVSAAVDFFGQLWLKLRKGLGEIAEIGEFSAGEYSLALFPPAHWQERPPLAYADAFAILREDGPVTQQRTEALARLIAFLGIGAAYRLALRPPIALGFGDGLAHIFAGTPAGLGMDFERVTAYRLFWAEGPPQLPGSPLDDMVWQWSRPGLKRVYEQFRAWQDTPEAYAAVRDRWDKAMAVEVGVSIETVESYLGQRRRRRRP